jgi:hypothetical protein
VHELDRHVWQSGQVALEPEAWRRVQQRLAAGPAWVLDGDLGPDDVLDARAARAFLRRVEGTEPVPDG